MNFRIHVKHISSKTTLFCCFFLFIMLALGNESVGVDPSDTLRLLLKSNSTRSIESEVSSILDSLTEAGYPFASITPIVENSDLIYLVVNKGACFQYFKLEQVGESLRPHLFKGATASFREFKALNSQASVLKSYLKHHSFIDSVTFYKPYHRDDTLLLPIELYTEKDFFLNGVLGYSNQNQSGVTGDFSITLLNNFSFGEMILFEYEGDKNSQRIGGELKLPYLFSLPLELSFCGAVEVEESYGYTDVDFGLSYLLPQLYRVGISAKHYELKEEENSLTFNGVGLTLEGSKGRMTKNSFGSKYNFEMLTGKRQEVTEAFTFRGSSTVAFHIPVRDFAFVAECSGGVIKSDSDSLRSVEKFRLGGLDGLRGYGENSIPIVAYELNDVSIRWYIGKDTFLYIGNELSLGLANSLSLSNREWYYDYGAGFSYPLKNMTFSIELFKAVEEPFKNSRLNIILTKR